MIEFKKIEWKNVLSYGNCKTTFYFTEGINKISGVNGVGKSVLVEIMHWVLFGKSYREIKKGQLINSKNKKNLEVYLEFNKQEDTFRIERGMKPDFFRIYKNNILVPVSSTVRGYQDILEEDILQFDENIYNQVTVKSLTKNMSFMTLTKAEKRKVTENLCDVEVFSIMGKNLKIKIDALEAELKVIKKDIENTNLLVTQEQSNLENLMNLKRRMEADAMQNIKLYTDEIAALAVSNAKYEKGLEIIARKKDQKKLKLEEIQTLKGFMTVAANYKAKAEAVIELNEKKAKFLTNTCGDCPKIQELLNDSDIKDTTKSLEDNARLAVIRQSELDVLEADLSKMNEILANERFVLESLTKNKRRVIELQSAINKSSETVIEIDETKIKEYNNSLVKLKADFNTQFDTKTHLVMLRSLCSDDGIKAFIIKKYLPTINKILNTYLTKFQTDIVFNFDTEFNEIVLTKYKEDYTYESFSQGQKKRIDLAIMFTFIKFAQMKNKKSDTNLLIMDEVLTSLDQQGTESVMQVLSDYRDKNNKCIITINHLTDMNQEFFDYSYNVTLEKGFSKITEVLS
jgi:DNA repair exonuclease SbcCD ATPase subunit